MTNGVRPGAGARLMVAVAAMWLVLAACSSDGGAGVPPTAGGDAVRPTADLAPPEPVPSTDSPTSAASFPRHIKTGGYRVALTGTEAAGSPSSRTFKGGLLISVLHDGTGTTAEPIVCISGSVHIGSAPDCWSELCDGSKRGEGDWCVADAPSALDAFVVSTTIAYEPDVGVKVRIDALPGVAGGRDGPNWFIGDATFGRHRIETGSVNLRFTGADVKGGLTVAGSCTLDDPGDPLAPSSTVKECPKADYLVVMSGSFEGPAEP